MPHVSDKDWSPSSNPMVRTLLAVGRRSGVGRRYRRRLERAFGDLHLSSPYDEGLAVHLARGIWMDEWKAEAGKAPVQPAMLEWLPSSTHMVACLTAPAGEGASLDAGAMRKSGYALLPEADLWVRPLMALPHRRGRLLPAFDLGLRLARACGAWRFDARVKDVP